MILPPPREPGRYRVGLVCLGNICRSPTADVVLSAKVAEAGLDRLGLEVQVESCGTGDWHVGGPMDERSAGSLRDAGYDGSAHRARQFDARWPAEHDVLLAMDRQNLADIGGRSDRALLLRDLDPAVLAGSEAEVPDPYYGGERGFEEVREMIERCCDAIVDELTDLAGQSVR